MKLKRIFLVLSLLVMGCATTDESSYFMPHSNDQTDAPGEAMTDEGMFYRKPASKREDKNVPFYFKHCALDDTGGGPFGSTNSYSCNDF